MGYFSRFVGPVAVLAMLAPVSGKAADDVAALRAEIDALKADYAQRVTALEARIEQLAASATTAAAAPVEPPPPAQSSPGTSPPARGSSAFNPSISVILAGNYADLSQDPGDFHIAGFMPSGGEVGPGERSFNLGESEVTLAASVDPYFTAALTMALSAEGEIGVEEAFFRTTSLPAGFSVKGGRFFSGFGYLNEIHAHAWDFVDQPLVYQAFYRRAVRPGRRAGEVARADGPVPRVRRGNGQRRRVPRHSPRPQRPQWHDAFHAPGRRPRRRDRVARGRVVDGPGCGGPHLRRRRQHRQCRRQLVHRQFARPGSSTRR